MVQRLDEICRISKALIKKGITIPPIKKASIYMEDDIK